MQLELRRAPPSLLPIVVDDRGSASPFIAHSGMRTSEQHCWALFRAKNKSGGQTGKIGLEGHLDQVKAGRKKEVKKSL